MRKLAWILAVVVALLVGALGVAFREGWLRSPWAYRHAELIAQLRDRGPVAMVGAVPFALRGGETSIVPVETLPALAVALDSNDALQVAQQLRRARMDGLLVRTDAPRRGAATVRGALGEIAPVRGLGAVYLDEMAALYEPVEPLEIAPEDARRLVAVARLVLAGAAAPPERLFPAAIRRTRPVEVALVVRDGREPILWRATRGGSIARALLDVTFAVLDRWSTRQQERYGRLREALATKTLTVAVFYDKGVLGSRSPAFLRRAVTPGVFSVGYERLTSWEYALPPTPWAQGEDPVQALTALARERGVPPPGHLRPEITLYRFRALQMIEESPSGPVRIYDPP